MVSKNCACVRVSSFPLNVYLNLSVGWGICSCGSRMEDTQKIARVGKVENLSADSQACSIVTTSYKLAVV